MFHFQEMTPALYIVRACTKTDLHVFQTRCSESSLQGYANCAITIKSGWLSESDSAICITISDISKLRSAPPISGAELQHVHSPRTMP